MRIINIINKFFRPHFVKRNKRLHIDGDYSIISSNCIGGVLYHDCKKRFDSPFINLWIKPSDFIKMLKRLDYYLNCNLEFRDSGKNAYPIGFLDDICIFFQHYKSNDEARKKWEERKKRINYDKICVIMTERDGCTFDDLLEFDKLPFRRKVVFTHKDYPSIRSAFYIKGFENDNEVGSLTSFVPGKIGTRYFDSFDFKKFVEEE